MLKPEKITINDILNRKKDKKRITALTAYDYPSAKIASNAGIDIILVGDSLGMVIQGEENTLKVEVEDMIYHTSLVSKAEPKSLIITDMPYMSYHLSIEKSVENAMKLIKYGGAEGVKIEGGEKRIDTIKAIIDSEIPVMGHLGLTPQSINIMGGFKVQGKLKQKAEEIYKDAIKLEKAGVFSIVLESIPEELSQIITNELKIPTIGIGAGKFCDGQILVFHDLLGISNEKTPKFVRKYANIYDISIKAIREYINDINSNNFPNDNETYHTKEDLKDL